MVGVPHRPLLPSLPKLWERAGASEFLIGHLLVRIHFIIEMTWWTGLAPWEFEAPQPEARNLEPRFLAEMEKLKRSNHFLLKAKTRTWP